MDYQDTFIKELMQHIDQHVEVATSNNHFTGILVSVDDKALSLCKQQNDSSVSLKSTWIPLSAISYVRLLRSNR